MAYTLKLIEGSDELDLNVSSGSGFQVKSFNPGFPEERDVYGGMTGDQLVRKQYGPRDMTMVLRLTGDDRDDMIDRYNDLRLKCKAASDYHEAGWGNEVFLQFQFDGATHACQWPVLSGRAVAQNELLDVGLEYAALKQYQMFVQVNLRTKAEWESPTTYSLENYLGTPHFEEDGNSDGLADQWTELGTPTTTLDTTVYLIGSQSQKVVTDAAGDDGIYSANVSDTETSGVGYAWVYKSSGDGIAVQLYDATASAIKDTALYAASGWETKVGANGNTWKRLVVSSDSLTSGNNHCLRIFRPTGGAAQATTFYVDQCYLELGTTTTPTGWKSGRCLENHWDSDSGHINYVDVADIPGDRPASARFYVRDAFGEAAWTRMKVGRGAHEVYAPTYKKEFQGTAGAGYSEGEYKSVTPTTNWESVDTSPLILGDDIFGQWRVFAAVEDLIVSGDMVECRIRWGVYNSQIHYNKVASPGDPNYMELLDLGIASLGEDAFIRGMTNNSLRIDLQYRRASGSAAVRFDFIIAIPIDGEICFAQDPIASGPPTDGYIMFDGLLERPYAWYLASDRTSIAPAGLQNYLGSMSRLESGVSNRIFFLNTYYARYYIDRNVEVSIVYRPRGLHFRGSDL